MTLRFHNLPHLFHCALHFLCYFSVAIATNSDVSKTAVLPTKKTDDPKGKNFATSTTVHRTINLPVINGKIQLTGEKPKKRPNML